MAAEPSLHDVVETFSAQSLSASCSSRTSRPSLCTVPEEGGAEILQFTLAGLASEGALAALGSPKEGLDLSVVYRLAAGGSAAVMYRTVSNGSSGVPSFSSEVEAGSAAIFFLLDVSPGPASNTLDQQLSLLECLSFHQRFRGDGRLRASVSKLLLVGGGDADLPEAVEQFQHGFGFATVRLETWSELPEVMASAAGEQVAALRCRPAPAPPLRPPKRPEASRTVGLFGPVGSLIVTFATRTKTSCRQAHGRFGAGAQRRGCSVPEARDRAVCNAGLPNTGMLDEAGAHAACGLGKPASPGAARIRGGSCGAIARRLLGE